MSVVKFPCKPKRQPGALAVAAPNPKRERMVARAERVVELLSTRFIRDDWSFDKNRATRFLHCVRTFDLKGRQGRQQPGVCRNIGLGFRSRTIAKLVTEPPI